MRIRIQKNQILLGLLMIGQGLVCARPQLEIPKLEIPKGCSGSTVDLLGPETAKQARAFLDELKAAVNLEDKAKIASMIAYPLRLSVGNETHPVRNRTEFLAKYAKIFTPHLKQVINDQTARCLFGNWQGAMVGQGELWFQQQSDGAFKLITIQSAETIRTQQKK